MMRSVAAVGLLVLFGLAACGSPAEQSDGGPDATAPDATADAIADATSSDSAADGSADGPADGADAAPVDPCSAANVGNGIQVSGATPLGANQGVFIVPPFAVSGVAVVAPTTLRVFFSEAMDPTDAANVANYSISPALAVTNAAVNPTWVDLTTATQAPATAYTLTVTGVRDTAQTATFPSATLPFEGYHFHANAYATPMSASPRQIFVNFTEPAGCAAATNAANYTVAGYTVASAANYSGPCNTTTIAIKLTLDHALSPGPHTLGIANVTSQASQPLSPATADFAGPDVPARFYVYSATSLSSAVQVEFNDLVDSASGALAANYATTPAITLTDGAVSNETATLGGTTAPNQVYRVDVSNVLLQGTNTPTSIPSAAMWGYGSFYPASVFSLAAHSLTIYFSDVVGAGVTNVANYTFSGGVTATGITSPNGGLLAKLTLAGDSPGQTYTVSVGSAVHSAANVPVATVYGGTLDVALSAPAYTGKLPVLRLAGEDLSIDRAPFFSQDGTHLYVDTGVLASGSYTVSVCGLQDAPRTSTLHTDVQFSIP
jgi:hypothetical protein